MIWCVTSQQRGGLLFFAVSLVTSSVSPSSRTIPHWSQPVIGRELLAGGRWWMRFTHFTFASNPAMNSGLRGHRGVRGMSLAFGSASASYSFCTSVIANHRRVISDNIRLFACVLMWSGEAAMLTLRSALHFTWRNKVCYPLSVF